MMGEKLLTASWIKADWAGEVNEKSKLLKILEQTS